MKNAINKLVKYGLYGAGLAFLAVVIYTWAMLSYLFIFDGVDFTLTEISELAIYAGVSIALSYICVHASRTLVDASAKA